MRGFVCIPRDEIDPRDELWGGERRLTRFEAWCDLRMAAAIRERTVTFRGERITVPVGGVLFSNRTLQERWGWTNKTVTAFLRDLAGAGLILSSTPTLGGTVMLLRAKDLPVDTEEDAPTLTPTVIPTLTPTVIPTRKEKGEKEESDKRSDVSVSRASARLTLVTDEPFERAWRAMPRREGSNSKQDAKLAFRASVSARSADPEELVAAAERYAAYVRADGNEGTKFVLAGKTFFADPGHYNAEWAVEETSVAEPVRNAATNGNGKGHRAPSQLVPLSVTRQALREAAVDRALDFEP